MYAARVVVTLGFEYPRIGGYVDSAILFIVRSGCNRERLLASGSGMNRLGMNRV